MTDLPPALPFCDAVYGVLALAFSPAFVGPTGDTVACAFYFARTADQPALPPLTVLDFEVGQLAPPFWEGAAARLEALARERRARYGSIGFFVEDLAIARTLQRRGFPVRPVPEHLAKPAAWDFLCASATAALRSGDLAWSVAARRRTDSEPCPARTFYGGPRPDDDPTVASYILGVVLGLDPTASIPPPPARVKLVQQSKR